jgi:transketolase
VVVYDANHISIEDDTAIALSEDTGKRYEAYGWHVQTVDWTHGEGTRAGHDRTYSEDVEALHDALVAARDETGRPSLVILRTVIAWPAPNLMNTGKSHGAALGDAEVRATKEILGFDPEQSFQVDESALAHARLAVDRGRQLHARWQERYDAWAAANPDGLALHHRLQARRLPDGWANALPVFEPSEKGVATRKASGEVLNALAPVLPELWGGSADLAESNNTTMEGEPSFLPEDRGSKMFPGHPFGRTLHFGIREHGMGSIMNGIALHGGTRVYGGTFLVFSDYMRGAVRLAALMGLPVTYVWTHDSIGLGRGRPDPPAGRAPRRAARDPEPGRRPPGRRQRDRLGVAHDPRAHRPARRDRLSRQNLPTFDRSPEGGLRPGRRRGPRAPTYSPRPTAAPPG